MSVETFTVSLIKKRNKTRGFVVCLTKNAPDYLQLYIRRDDLIDYFINGHYGAMTNQNIVFISQFIKPINWDFNLIAENKIIKLYPIVKGINIWLQTDDKSAFNNPGDFFSV